MAKRVLVLMGGISAEREVSLVSGAAVAKSLAETGYEARAIDVGNDVRALLDALASRPDAVFNALHGRFGEDGCVQGVLELMRIPYTHSGVLASALAMDKPTARRLFAAAGIPVPEGRVVARAEVIAGRVMDPPFVIKPLNEGSSVGVKIVLEDCDLAAWACEPWPFGGQVLVERYIPGREITVAVMGERALGVLEIRPRNGFYDYAAKYTPGKASHLVPAPMPGAAYDEALRLALLAHRTLGCRGVSRADLRYDDTGGPPGRLYLLEVNTQPGMTALSLVPEIAAEAGISFGALVSWMVENATCERQVA
ncbi:MAG: D-alanine--D-alanine ligase [Pseudomonadota bacterium]